jgi:hypothetical protein
MVDKWVRYRMWKQRAGIWTWFPKRRWKTSRVKLQSSLGINRVGKIAGKWAPYVCQWVVEQSCALSLTQCQGKSNMLWAPRICQEIRVCQFRPRPGQSSLRTDCPSPPPPPPWWKDNSLRPIVTNAVQWRSRINRYNIVHFSTLVAFLFYYPSGALL